MAIFNCKTCSFSKTAPNEWIGRNAICPKCKQSSTVFWEFETPPADYEYPPAEATLICECGFETPPFFFSQHVYRCNRCKLVDFPRSVPFVYDTPNCSKCHTKFDRQDRIHARRMTPVSIEYKPSEWSRVSKTPPELVLCPKCMGNKLGLNHLGIHVQCAFDGAGLPEDGQLIHTRLRSSPYPEIPYLIFVPRLDVEYTCSYQMLKLPAEGLNDGHHEFRVMKTSKTDPKLTLEYMRELDPDEWAWYFGR